MARAEFGPQAGPANPPAGLGWDVGVTAALRRMPEGDLLAHPCPSAGSLHLFGCDLGDYLRQWMIPRFQDARPTRFPGWSGWIPPRGSRFVTGHGMVWPEASPGLVAQVAAGIAFAVGRDHGRVVGLISPRSTLASGAWHEAIAFAGATRVPLVVVVHGKEGPHRAGRTDLPAAARAHGASYQAVQGDFLSAWTVTRLAVERARTRRGLHMIGLVPGGSPEEANDMLVTRALRDGLTTPEVISEIVREVDMLVRDSIDAVRRIA